MQSINGQNSPETNDELILILSVKFLKSSLNWVIDCDYLEKREVLVTRILDVILIINNFIYLIINECKN